MEVIEMDFRMRLGDDMEAAENVLIELEEKGAATVRFNDGLGAENHIGIRRICGHHTSSTRSSKIAQ
jgi:hypothetical protein